MLNKMKNLMGFNVVEPEGPIYYKCTTKVCDYYEDWDGSYVFINEEQECGDSGCSYVSCSC